MVQRLHVVLAAQFAGAGEDLVLEDDILPVARRLAQELPVRFGEGRACRHRACGQGCARQALPCESDRCHTSRSRASRLGRRRGNSTHRRIC
jgi:hypothetical protein